MERERENGDVGLNPGRTAPGSASTPQPPPGSVSPSTNARTTPGSPRTEKGLWTKASAPPALFAEHEGAEPTNNRAERGLRKLVLWRKNSFGSDSAAGLKLVERLLSVLESCRLQKRNAFTFFCDSLLAHRAGTLPPALFVAR